MTSSEGLSTKPTKTEGDLEIADLKRQSDKKGFERDLEERDDLQQSQFKCD